MENVGWEQKKRDLLKLLLNFCVWSVMFQNSTSFLVKTPNIMSIILTLFLFSIGERKMICAAFGQEPKRLWRKLIAAKRWRFECLASGLTNFHRFSFSFNQTPISIRFYQFVLSLFFLLRFSYVFILNPSIQFILH